MNVVFFHRHPVTNVTFGIEQYFETVRSFLPGKIETSVAVSRHLSTSVWRCAYNAAEAAFRQGDVNHITGDIHYVAFLLRKRKTLLTIHDCGFEEHPSAVKRAILKWFWLQIPLKRVSRVVTDSEFSKQRIVALSGCDPEFVQVVPICISPMFRAIHRTFNASYPSILQVGTTPNKNLERTAAALKELPCRLIIVGPLSGAQQAMLESSNLDWLNLAGLSDEELLKVYGESDIVVFASTYEGFGMPIIEANVVGRPVITSKVASMPEVAGNSACLVDPYSVESIRESVIHVIKDEPYRKQLVENGFLNALRFRPEVIAADHLEIYRQLWRKERNSI